ncbi:MAG: disulfide bond formation protein B [Rhizobiales bacterium]|nr:disulfide bond formation protein B [Hyphomicrobiales bacterium]
MTELLRRDWAAPAVVLVIGLATILTAWGFQIVGGYIPCALCLQQRVPYYVGLPIALVALVISVTGTRPMVVRILLIAVALAFAVGAFIGVYQAGAEWGFWPGPASCGAASGGGDPGTSLLEQIKHIRVVSCTEAHWRFLGLSFAGWNAVVSAGLFLIALFGAFRQAEPARKHAHA